jgi:signal peptidase I
MSRMSQTISKHKDPWIAANLSKLLPGAGQLYAHRWLRGIVILALSLLSLVVGLNLFVSTEGSLSLGMGLLSLSFPLWIWNMWDAHHCIWNLNLTEGKKAQSQNRNPWIAIFWSSFIPGLGHFYLRKRLIGIVLVMLSLIFIFLPLIGILWACFVIYITYKSIPQGQGQSSRLITQFIALFFVLTLGNQSAALLIRSYVVETRYIPAASMESTLKVNDRVVIEKMSYRYRKPRRGEIVVFNPTQTLRDQGFKDAFIKRIVGLPGDQVEIKQGGVYINTQRLTENYVTQNEPTTLDTCALGDTAPFLAHGVTIPKDSYLVLGDDRSNSYDSRCWGLVEGKEIVGRANKIYYPFDRAGAILTPQYPDTLNGRS